MFITRTEIAFLACLASASAHSAVFFVEIRSNLVKFSNCVLKETFSLQVNGRVCAWLPSTKSFTSRLAEGVIEREKLFTDLQN